MNKSNRELQFENELVSVWKTKILPDMPLKITNTQMIIGLNGQILEGPTTKSSQEPLEVMLVEMKSSQKRSWPSRPID